MPDHKPHIGVGIGVIAIVFIYVIGLKLYLLDSRLREVEHQPHPTSAECIFSIDPSSEGAWVSYSCDYKTTNGTVTDHVTGTVPVADNANVMWMNFWDREGNLVPVERIVFTKKTIGK